MIPYLKLPLQFDPVRLRADLQTAQDFNQWTAHFNKTYYNGDWSGIALRTTKGTRHPLYIDPTVTEFTDTPVLAQCPYFAEVVRSFHCPVETARLLRLGAGASIKAHSDFALEYTDGKIRVHIPVVTNPQVDFVLNGERLSLLPGEAWFLNVNLVHSVHNGGETDRVHLVIDCEVNDWVREMFGDTDGTELRGGS